MLLGLLVLAATNCAPPSEPASVLVLSADSLRADRLALYNRSGGVATPQLEALAAAGTRFEQMWAVAPWTAPAMVSVFTGLYPPSHGVAYRDDSTPRDLPTLPRLAADAGYAVGNFSFFSGISYFRNLGLPPPAPGLRHDREPEAFARFLDELTAEQPFMAWIHLLHPHLPYGASGYAAREVSVAGSSGLEAAQLSATLPIGSAEFVDGDGDRLRALYDADVVGLDAAVGEVLAALDIAPGRAGRTLVVFLADHGEELLEHGWVGHASTAMTAKLIPEILHIPLILRGPGVAAGALSSALAQHVDVLPTLLALLGWQPPERLDGVPLLVQPTRTAALRRLVGLGPRPRRWLYFDSSPGGNLTPPEQRTQRLQGVADRDCLYRSRTGPDGETVDLLPLEPGKRCQPAAFAAALADWRARQLEQRLGLLAEAEATAPASSEIDRWAEAITVVTPAVDEALSWQEHGGQLEIAWQDPSESFWVEYDIGREPLRVRGAFAVEQRQLRFGPFPAGFWNDLARYSPFRFRVADPAAQRRSAWRQFTLVATR